MSPDHQIRIAKFHEKIKIGMSEIKIGLSLSIAQNEVMRFGLDTDKKFGDIMYFGEMMGVNKALEMGVIDDIVPDMDNSPGAVSSAPLRRESISIG